MRAFKTMMKTELKLSLRGMDMFIFAICAPLVVLVLLGILYGDKPAFEGAGYRSYADNDLWEHVRFGYPRKYLEKLMGSRHFIFAKFRHGCLESVYVRKAVVYFVLLSIEPAYA